MIDNDVKSPPSVIASFEEMAIIVHTNKNDEPHIVVEIRTEKFTIALWVDDRISSNSLEALAAYRKIARWFRMEVPGTGNPPRRVWNLIYDQWLRGRNWKPTEHVPTPDEITGMYRKRLIRITPKKLPRKIGDYNIRSIVPLPQYRLKVYFKRGEVRIVDIKDMCGDACWIQGAYQNFDQVKVSGGAWWEVGDYSEGIEDQDLWSAGDLVDPLNDHEPQIPFNGTGTTYCQLPVGRFQNRSLFVLHHLRQSCPHLLVRVDNHHLFCRAQAYGG